MKKLRRLWYRLVPTYHSLETLCVTYYAADRMIRESANKPEGQRWEICQHLEDRNRIIGVCYLERKVRIVQ